MEKLAQEEILKFIFLFKKKKKINSLNKQTKQ